MGNSDQCRRGDCREAPELVQLRVSFMTSNQLRYVEALGPSIVEVLDDVSRLRMELFRDYPYCYAGNLDYEQNYLRGLSENHESLVIAAYAENELVGTATALPLESSADILEGARDRFSNAGLRPEICYYYSEILVRPGQRRRGIAGEFYRRRDATARRLGYSTLCFAALDTSTLARVKPARYFDPSDLWRRMGFVSNPELYVDYHWPTLQADGSSVDTEHRLYFWVRHLDLAS